MTDVDTLLEPAETVADGVTALVGVTDAGLERIADGVEAFREMMPLIVAAAEAATSPLVERINGFRGADGTDGKDGAEGTPGPQGLVGPPGEDGRSGTDGQDGAEGVPGPAGKAGSRGAVGSPGREGAKGDKGLNWRGSFDRDIAYQPDDAMEFEGSSFVAVASVRGVSPPGNGWELLARRGAQGVSGSLGGGGGGTPLSNATPLVDSGLGSAGTGTRGSRFDHVHPITPGSGGDLSFTHTQLVPATVWTVVHNLGKRPSVTVVDSADTYLIADVIYLDNDQLEVHAANAFGGKAYCN